MDLSRRLAAGELSELFGAVAVEQDKQTRLFHFRKVARAVIEQAPPEQRAVLEAYARGVNARLVGSAQPALGILGARRAAGRRGGPRTRFSSSIPCGGTCRPTGCSVSCCGARSTRASAGKSAMRVGSADCGFFIRRGRSGMRRMGWSGGPVERARWLRTSCRRPRESRDRMCWMSRRGARAADGKPWGGDRVGRSPGVAPPAGDGLHDVGSNNWAIAGRLTTHRCGARRERHASRAARSDSLVSRAAAHHRDRIRAGVGSDRRHACLERRCWSPGPMATSPGASPTATATG